MAPAVGINAETGAALTGWDHVQQSLAIILRTQFGERPKREFFGSFVPDLLGRSMATTDLSRFIAALTSAIEQFEPRFDVASITTQADPRDGSVQVVMLGNYRPNALTGDLAVDGDVRQVTVGSSGLIR